MTPDDVYWDELGVAWRATNPEVTRLTGDLKARATRQWRMIAALLAVGIPLSVAGAALGLFTIWIGWSSGAQNFVTRGIAIDVISALCLRALLSFRPLSAPIETASLSELLDTLAARTRRTLVLLRIGLAACAIAAVFGVIGVMLRTRSGAGPQMSPVIDLVLLALIALALWAYVGRVESTRAKFEHLRRTLGATREDEPR